MPIREDLAALTVTVVDDEPSMRDILVRAAWSWGYACQSAGNAEEALPMLAECPTPLVVTDLRMPGNGGVWLVREIQRLWPGTGIIVVTAGEDNDAALECLNAGADRYLLKPLRLEEFRHALAATLRTVQLEKERERYRRHLERMVQEKTRHVRRTFLSAIDSLVRTLEARDPYTKGHSLRVRHLALRLATALGLDRATRRKLSLAAKLHDIGKVGIPEEILNKPSRLTEAQFNIIRAHPQIGERILTPIIRSREVLAAIRGHHERLDGQGYPDGLKGGQVPLLARLIAIADCYDAMTSSRAYREALTHGQAMDVLRSESGKHFEPEFVCAFQSVADESVLAQTSAVG
ncbi:MAG TPA: HD domain-containing phosphohydrolase [Gemmataceae bacterium]|nr:HD domain-containing phosphohydrolase [Gemmataceae bacterium]